MGNFFSQNECPKHIHSILPLVHNKLASQSLFQRAALIYRSSTGKDTSECRAFQGDKQKGNVESKRKKVNLKYHEAMANDKLK